MAAAFVKAFPIILRIGRFRKITAVIIRWQAVKIAEAFEKLDAGWTGQFFNGKANRGF